MNATPVLLGARLRLAPFGPRQISERYLGWLADPVVNEFSRRRDMPPAARDDAEKYLVGLRTDEAVLAIESFEFGHIGNVKYGPIDSVNKRSDIAIMIGEKAAWGHGLGAEAVYLVTRWLFESRGMNKVDAGSTNPAFLKLVGRLGWQIEKAERSGTAPERKVVAMFACDFQRLKEFESVDGRFVLSQVKSGHLT